MIVNSYPHNPSQQARQQRCIGLSNNQQQSEEETNQQKQISNFNNTFGNNQSSLATMFTHQQNSLYGSSQIQPNNLHQSHMLDLANLQQSVLDSNHDIQTSEAPSAVTRQQQKQTSATRAIVDSQQAQHQQVNDISLYSPSSSTSLLYHIYDQINLPSEHQYNHHQQQQQQQSSVGIKKNNTTTILNPANLFNQHPPPLPLQAQFHQSQLSSNSGADDFSKTLAYHQQQQQQQQQCYSTSQYNHLQQPFNTLHNGQYQQQMMLDNMLRQHHATSRRPLSSSGNSSGTSMSTATTTAAAANQITYGRQQRTLQGNNKSHNNLASVLASNNTINHLGIIGAGNSNTSTITGKASNLDAIGTPYCCLFNSRLKRFNQRTRNVFFQYKSVIICSMLLILLALCLMTIVQYTLFSASNQSHQASLSSANSNNPFTSNHFNHIISSHSDSLSNNNNLFYPPPFAQPSPQPSTKSHIVTPDLGPSKQASAEASSDESSKQDVLMSKLVIGEFVITSQNYSHSEAQRLLLAERIVKLMDQVFLATDVRRLYSRMEVISIRPNRPSGIVVDCNIILTESIGHAAQLFGLALFDSLSKSEERLANQVNYIIDRNSIRFNTVPDKDLKSGIVPPGLISPSVTKELISASTPSGSFDHSQTPSMGLPDNLDSKMNKPATSLDHLDNPEQMNMVVWSGWSQWSSCVDKNGFCDATRLHSRLRRCMAQNTGENVDPSLCRAKFNSQDQELEVSDCQKRCQQQQQASSGVQQDSNHVPLSDAPSIIGPQTAPSVLINSLNNEHSALMPFMLGPASSGSFSKSQAKPMTAASVGSSSLNKDGNYLDLYAPASPSSIISPASGSAPNQVAAVAAASSTSVNNLIDSQAISTTERSSPMLAGDLLSGSSQAPTLLLQNQPNLQEQQQHQQQMSCSNCTGDEICLLLMSQKVPFCAKMKDRLDDSGCGGWCKAQNQLCQPVGQNAFKCIHDSECLAEEWRCHDSACIPLSKRCDGHSNCYDNSDERDCPI